MVWDIPLVSWGQPSQLCPLPAPCAPPASSLVGWCEEQKRPWLCVSAAQQQLKHPCVINIIFILNPKHSTIPVSRKKINFIPAKTRTAWLHIPNSLLQNRGGVLLPSLMVGKEEARWRGGLWTSLVDVPHLKDVKRNTKNCFLHT